ncbi:Trimeric intracellular cation channel type B [Oryzias melastigma]|uniref:Transmembrane protein 38B n=1 Tax=Oryzias melastigma TaxID=30732 RepID=A0A3B3DB21_ORYME|nr:trimeric intracellular cation channel type B [Oryzias melastigma]KAF6729163.1 Trimeric intracellular cation channel type B [Oryzias melastigma]
MDLLALPYLDELSHGLANLSMFPYFDMAHYIVSVMALREQPGALEVSRASPLACWFSSMLYCFGGAVLSGVMLAEPPVAPLSNGTGVLLASIVWYLIFYCPKDAVYSSAALLPLRLVLSGMKEVTRTWKVLGGVTQARQKYKDSLLVMIAIGWARGAGGGLISNFEQLVRGVWKPETNELLKMSYPTKITLIGAVLFTLQQTHYLPLQKHHLMLVYTVFIVVNKSRMMLTGSSSSPFAAIESILYKTLFTGHSPYSALTGEVKEPCIDNGDAKSAAKENGSSRSPGAAGEGQRRAKEEPKSSDAKKSKKIN